MTSLALGVVADNRSCRAQDDEALTLADLWARRDIAADAICSLFIDANPGLLLVAAAELRDRGHGRTQSYSRKVFIPLTQLCRNYCHYCTFSQPRKEGRASYLSREEVLAIAREGAAAGCTEALFTLGDKPELRFCEAREELDRLGHATTLGYLEEMARMVRDETGLLPHINAGAMTREEISALRKVSASQGLMLETVAERLCDRGGVHHRSPDKLPAVRLQTIRLAGELAVPFTTGLLIGIGETRRERIETLLAIRKLHDAYGHIQEVIVQNFRAKPGTAMANAPEPDIEDLLWTIACARLLFGPEMNIQAPPNLSAQSYPRLISAGINDWGGVSPITPDHVNPEAPWPDVERLREATAEAGRILVARLPVYPLYAQDNERWQDVAMIPHMLAGSDAEGFARDDIWSPGLTLRPGPRVVSRLPANATITRIVARALQEERLDKAEVTTLFSARDVDLEYVCEAANRVRTQMCGDTVTYVVNRNINYTNMCVYKCGFCAFSKGDKAETLRGQPYDLDLAEVIRRTNEAAERGATEVCLQGGIHPQYTGDTYLDLARTIRVAVPSMHIHAFSPLEVWQGASTLGLSVEAYLGRLKDAGLNTLPGTAAEILDDEVRARICPDKLSTDQWLTIVRSAHEVGFRTTATIMFGHVDTPLHWARHLLAIRDLQAETGGFTEFVPLPFVHMEAPMGLRGQTRSGPTFREVRLMHAIARLALHPLLPSIQTSWVKMGIAGVKACLNGGANDLGGTLMNESISRAAGTQNGQEMPPAAMEALIWSIGRVPRQRATDYGTIDPETHARGLAAPVLTSMVLTPPDKHRHEKTKRTAYAN